MNSASHDELYTSQRSSTMSTCDASTPGIAAAAYTTPLVNLCLRFPQPGLRAIPVLGNDQELWFLVADECDNDWNQWIVASSEGACGHDWVVRRIVWWGNYTDWHEEYTNWFIEPMLSSTFASGPIWPYCAGAFVDLRIRSRPTPEEILAAARLCEN